MISRKQADELSEEAIIQYTQDAGAETTEDLVKLLELLISKSARAIEKQHSHEEAIKIMHRTFMNLCAYSAIKEDKE